MITIYYVFNVSEFILHTVLAYYFAFYTVTEDRTKPSVQFLARIHRRDVNLSRQIDNHQYIRNYRTIKH